MKSIWKYPLYIATVQQIEMRKDAKILSVQTQNGDPCMWALVDEDAANETKTIYMYGTGHSITSEVQLQYIGTAQSLEGNFVYHVFVKN